MEKRLPERSLPKTSLGGMSAKGYLKKGSLPRTIGFGKSVKDYQIKRNIYLDYLEKES